MVKKAELFERICRIERRFENHANNMHCMANAVDNILNVKIAMLDKRIKELEEDARLNKTTYYNTECHPMELGKSKRGKKQRQQKRS